ncbi:TetR/AcrR family transcriptional regulator [Rhodococcus sp. 14-2483-1-1]|uniref:TetR/AcrR family transcriptional regulator n=1 Tax=Nocardiaceae TaxID=85025 RepID=UPI00050D020A|nr:MULTISPECIES: TetR/AcrR family transcriptional regulator [Rhodococcus]OZE83948.1 TetR/AcrR family transcriptional regulator [Rhodococcus sp. 15-649-2-2]OZF39196.1 TetR/AcrR family transcriptional regulator [Rhodococcus sp. 14-2483-1-1]
MSTNPPPGAERSHRARPRKDRRQALIDAAIELLAEGNSADISAAAISRRAGVAHGLLFYYFTDKQGLVAAALADVLSKLSDFQEPAADEESVRARMEGFVRRHIEFLERHRALYVRVVREGELGDSVVEHAVREARAEGALQVAALAELPEPLSPLQSAAISGWTGFLDRTADAYFDTPDLQLDAVVALVVDTFEAVVGAAQSRPDPTT